MSDNNKFRVVTVGGFNKDDVLSYIANIEHKVVLLKDEFAIEKKELEKALEDATERLSGYEVVYNDRVRLQAENDRLTLMVQEYSQNDNDAVISNLQHENSELRFKLQQATNQKDDLGKLKETLVQLELDAHLRAKAVEEKAKLEAEEILLGAYQQAKEIEVQSEQKIIDLKAKVSDITGQTQGEFARIDEILLHISEKNEELRNEMNYFAEVFEEEKEKQIEVNEIYEML